MLVIGIRKNKTLLFLLFYSVYNKIHEGKVLVNNTFF